MTMSSKAYKVGFFVLLLINIALIMVIKFGPKPHGSGKGMRDEISLKLNFDEEQNAKFRELVRKHRDQVADIRKEEQTLIKQYFGGLNSDTQELQQDQLVEEINQVQKKKLEVTYAHFQEVRSICTNEQLLLYKELMDEMTQVLIGENRRPDR
ncbi:MAG: hypothetical protein Roseis2KO_25010 [Roseivirga sp.]